MAAGRPSVSPSHPSKSGRTNRLVIGMVELTVVMAKTHRLGPARRAYHALIRPLDNIRYRDQDDRRVDRGEHHAGCGTGEDDPLEAVRGACRAVRRNGRCLLHTQHGTPLMQAQIGPLTFPLTSRTCIAATCFFLPPSHRHQDPPVHSKRLHSRRRGIEKTR